MFSFSFSFFMDVSFFHASVAESTSIGSLCILIITFEKLAEKRNRIVIMKKKKLIPSSLHPPCRNKTASVYKLFFCFFFIYIYSDKGKKCDVMTAFDQRKIFCVLEFTSL